MKLKEMLTSRILENHKGTRQEEFISEALENMGFSQLMMFWFQDLALRCPEKGVFEDEVKSFVDELSLKQADWIHTVGVPACYKLMNASLNIQQDITAVVAKQRKNNPDISVSYTNAEIAVHLKRLRSQSRAIAISLLQGIEIQVAEKVKHGACN